MAGPVSADSSVSDPSRLPRLEPEVKGTPTVGASSRGGAVDIDVSTFPLASGEAQQRGVQTDVLGIEATDPLLAYLRGVRGPVDITRLDFASPALARFRAAGTSLLLPLVTSGALVGLLDLGPRLNARAYSSDDHDMLERLAQHASPALRIAQLARQQQDEARRRDRMDQELRLAELIQRQFLPQRPPALPGWGIGVFYRPALSVGGDFYDFIDLPDDRLFITVGDVTDKGMPAALIMASVHAVLRAIAPELLSPGPVLERGNELMLVDIPDRMFVTCLCLALDPRSGRVVFANAGHSLPYLKLANDTRALVATGMPLGCLPGMRYDEHEVTLGPDDCLLLHSDGLAEAHNTSREMFGLGRLAHVVTSAPAGERLIGALLEELGRFVGDTPEQEDDITLVTLHRDGTSGADHRG